MAGVEILGVPFSNYVRSVCMALEEKGVPFTLTPSRPHTPEIDAIHPLGKIPCLRHGDFSLCESKAIATYVDRAFPGPALFPQEAKAAALVEQWVSLLNNNLIPTVQPFLAAYFFPQTPDCTPDRAVIDALSDKVASVITLLNGAVGAHGFLAGGAFTYADIAVLPVLDYLRALPESGNALKGAPALAAYIETHAARASFVKTAPPPMAALLEMTHGMVRARRAAG